MQVLEERKKIHGDFTMTAAAIQDTKGFWKTHPGWQNLSAVQREALEMVAHKVGRILCGDPNCEDHWTDIAGYATLVAQRLPK